MINEFKTYLSEVNDFEYITSFLIAIKKKITNDTFEMWLRDTEHGLFHGLVTGFIAWSINNSTGCPTRFLNIIHHDFVRGIRGGEFKDHDVDLCMYFNMCDNISTHSRSDKVSIIRMADQIELMRFADYRDWIDYSKFVVDIKTFNKWEIFYQTTRVELSNMFFNILDESTNNGIDEMVEFISNYKKAAKLYIISDEEL